MGTDIHFHAEIKVDGVWEHYAHTRVARDYNSFAKLAGVRGSIDDIPISEPKGLPADASRVTKLHADYMDGDGHSHTWLDADEIDVFTEWYEVNHNGREPFVEFWINTYLCGNGWNVNRYPDSKPDFVEDVRWVFWFDS